jgi:hypothetical protein
MCGMKNSLVTTPCKYSDITQPCFSSPKLQPTTYPDGLTLPYVDRVTSGLACTPLHEPLRCHHHSTLQHTDGITHCTGLLLSNVSNVVQKCSIAHCCLTHTSVRYQRQHTTHWTR